MADDKQKMYQVTAEAVLATVDTQFGRMKTLLYKGAMLPASTPELRHLLDSNMVAEVGDDAGVGLNAEGGLGPAESPADGPDSVVSPRARTAEELEADRVAAAEAGEVERKRADAKAKLPADGSAPDGRSSDAVLVEYLVGRGYDRTEVEKASSPELRKLTKDAASK